MTNKVEMLSCHKHHGRGAELSQAITWTWRTPAHPARGCCFVMAEWWTSESAAIVWQWSSPSSDEMGRDETRRDARGEVR